jgi:hypothetical protein
MAQATARPGKPVPPPYRPCEVRRVEVFAAGTHRGRVYSESDLDELVANFDKFGPTGLKLITPPTVLGHEEDQEFLERSDLPAAGVVSRLWREGPKLYADFADVPEPVAGLINARAYRKVSIEHYDRERPFDAGDGRKFSDLILRRVALLGAEVPQVKALADLPIAVFSYADREVAVFKAPEGGAVFAFAEARPVSDPLAEKVKKLPRFAQCFADGALDRNALLDRIKAALPGVDSATLDGLDDQQLMGLALGCPPVPESTPADGAAGMQDYPDRAAMIADLVAAGGDAAALEAMTDDELKAKYAALKGGQFRDKPVTTPATTPPPPAQTQTQAAAFAEQKRKLDAEIAASEAERKRLEAERKRAEADRKKARHEAAVAFCDGLVRDGRMTPADRDAFFLPQLAAADDTDPCHKFSENGREEQVTEYERLRRRLASRPVTVKMGERLRAGGDGQSDEEVEKVQKFCELNGHHFPGKDLVAEFKAIRAKNPKATARQYLGADNVE